MNFRYSYSFVGLTGICLYSHSSVQLHKKMVFGIIFRKLQLQLHKDMVLDASFLLTVEVFLLTVRLFYLRWGNRK